MSDVIKNRSEILFIYDVANANPNGDPVDENKPRIDEEAGVNIVTDVRLKRTIRDYLHDFRQQEIFIKEVRDKNGDLKRKEDIYAQYGTPDKVLEKCIDIRLFGGTFALKGDKKKVKKSEEKETEGISEKPAFSITGPVQFKFGRSLHKVGEPTFIKGTTVMPSKAEKTRGTMVERYILPYSLIAFYGVVNENAAKTTNLTLTDVDLLIEGIWNGTKNLISHSKVGQMPRLLLQVIYKEKDFHLGELDRLVCLNCDKRGEKIRDISETKLDVTELAKKLEENKGKIAKIRIAKDDRLTLEREGNVIEPSALAGDVEIEVLRF